MPSFHDHLLVVVTTVGLPLYAIFLFQWRLQRALPTRITEVRISTYRTGIVVPWLLTAWMMAAWAVQQRAWTGLGLGFPLDLRAVTGLVLAGAIIAFASWQRLSVREAGAEEQVAEQLDHVELLLPHSRRELRWFLGVSLTAGICEELLFRGFIFWYLELLTPTWAAVLLSSLLFGMAHAYQGTRGVLQTGAVGLVLGLLRVFTGALWVPILLHAFIDVNSGLLAYDILRERDEPEPGAPVRPEDSLDP